MAKPYLKKGVQNGTWEESSTDSQTPTLRLTHKNIQTYIDRIINTQTLRYTHTHTATKIQ